MITINEAEVDYLEYLAARDRSQSTSATYAHGLKRFRAYLHRQHGMTGEEPVGLLTQRHADGFGIYLYRLKLAATTRSTYLVVLRNWFRYLGRHPELPEGSPVNPDLIELPKNVRKVPSPDERLTLMLSTTAPEADDPWRAIIRLRDQAMLETLFSTQLRVSELVSLNRNSIDWSQGIAVVTGKGRKTRTVFFSQRALQAVQAYLDARKDAFLPLFIHHDRAHKAPPRAGRVPSPLAGEGQRGRAARRAGNSDGDHMRLTRQSVERVVRKYARIAGVDATPHTFRHYGATELLRNGADIRTVQELLGHASVQTTQIYTHVSPRRLQQEWRRFHPAVEERNDEQRR